MAPPPLPKTVPTGPCILIVDDDRTTRFALSKPLIANGYKVLEAPKLSDAQAQLDANDIKLMIVDGLLPDGTGLEFITGLRNKGVMTPVIFASSFSKHFQTQGTSLTALKVAGVLTKPISQEQLLGMVRRALEAVAPAPLTPPAMGARPLNGIR